MQHAVGEVAPESELGRWLTWLHAYVAHADPLSHVRARANGTLTLYYHGYDKTSVAQHGFQEPTQPAWSQDKIRAGVELTTRPPRVSRWETAYTIELEEAMLLPFEWAQPQDSYWRVFYVPARLLNEKLGLARSTAQ